MELVKWEKPMNRLGLILALAVSLVASVAFSEPMSQEMAAREARDRRLAADNTKRPAVHQLADQHA